MIDPKKGLPYSTFIKISSMTPLVCVDLLICSKKKILLTWREDEFYGPGWHLPGGILRFKEKLHDRLIKTAKKELNVKIKMPDKKPIAINEQINPKRDKRGHFIALLYKCQLLEEPPKELRFNTIEKRNGTWLWHSRFPVNMIRQHYIYKSFFQSN